MAVASTRRATAPRRRTSSSPAQRRAALRVIPKNYKTKAARRRHVRRLLAAASVSVCAIVFLVLTLQVMLTQGQFRLQKIHKQIGVEKQEFVRLRAQVGELESPSRVIGEATARLGMQMPTAVHYLQPVRPMKSPSAEDDVVDDSLTRWSQLKQLQAALP